MKIWCVCAWEQFYPLGGVRNIVKAFDTEKEAREFAKKFDEDNAPDEYGYSAYEYITVEPLEVTESMEGFR